jgi:multicomponent Na+:H+ antiporter subunit G
MSVDLFAEMLLVAGAAWFLLAGIGVARLGDSLARVHAATKATTLGMMLMVLGAVLHAPTTDALKLVLAIALVALTNPVGGHLLGRAVEGNPGTAEVRIDVRATVDPVEDDEDPEAPPPA